MLKSLSTGAEEDCTPKHYKKFYTGAGHTDTRPCVLLERTLQELQMVQYNTYRDELFVIQHVKPLFLHC